MIPGRGNFAKTGRSIPSPFKQKTSAEVDKMIKDKQAREAAKKEAEKKAGQDQATKELRIKLRQANSQDNENRALSDSTSVHKKLKLAGFNDETSGVMGNKAGNETRSKKDNAKIMPTADFKAHVYKQVNLDPKTKKYKKVDVVDPPLKQKVASEVDAMIKRKQSRDATNSAALADSTSVHKKLKLAGFNDEVSGRMGNKAGNETREKWKGQFGYSDRVDLDPKTGKYKKALVKASPTKQTTSAQKKATQDIARGPSKEIPSSKNPKSGSNTIGGRSLEKNGIRGTKYEPGKTNAEMQRVYKSSPAKQCFPTPQEKADSAKKKFENRKDNPMAKGPSKDPKSGTKYEPGKPNAEMRRVYKDSPAKQLGRQAVTKMGGKKTPAKMKVSKKTAYDIKEASNQKLKPSARKNYAENAQAAMKNKKTPAKMKKC